MKWDDTIDKLFTCFQNSNLHFFFRIPLSSCIETLFSIAHFRIGVRFPQDDFANVDSSQLTRQWNIKTFGFFFPHLLQCKHFPFFFSVRMVLVQIREPHCHKIYGRFMRARDR